MKIAGLPVIDATKKLTISITSKDAAIGNAKAPGSCAAARACIRLPYCTEARVHLGRTYLKVGHRFIRYATPHALRTEIISFDRGAMFQAGKYTLLPMDASHIEKTRAVKRQGSNVAAKPGGRKSKRAKPHLVRGVREHGALNAKRG